MALRTVAIEARVTGESDDISLRNS